MTDIQFSIATPTRNSLAGLRRCVGSIRQQQGARWEHLVQDGASTDDTVPWLSGQPDLNWKSEPDTSLYEAVTRAWARSHGDILSYLNTDEQYLPDTLATVAAAFAAHPEIDAVFGDAILCDAESGLPLVARREIPLRKRYLTHGPLYALSCTLFFRRRLLDQGLLTFRPDLQIVADAELVHRLLSAGVQFLHLRRYLALFGISGNNLSTGSSGTSEIHRLRTEWGTAGSPWSLPIRSIRVLEKAFHGCYLPTRISYPFCIDENGHTVTHSARRLGARWRWTPPVPPTKRIGLYALDLDHHRLASPGIFNYTRQLIHALAAGPNPGFHIRLWLSSANAADLCPSILPAWMTARILPGNYAAGWRRLLADHGWGALLPCIDHVDAVHYPKGWLPFFKIGSAASIVTMHDTIVHYLAKHYPDSRSRFKHRYFINASLQSLRKANIILTDSRFSAQELGKLNPNRISDITITDPGPGLSIDGIPPAVLKRDQLVVIGSRIPYKATETTLSLLADFVTQSSRRWTILVTTLAHWPHDWEPLPASLDVRFTGPIDDTTLINELARSRALVFLSEIEGFGMPALEAYLCGIPVGYRNGTATAELLESLPGGWDGTGPASFIRALDAALAIAPDEIDNIRHRLTNRYNWSHCARQTLSAYRTALYGPET